MNSTGRVVILLTVLVLPGFAGSSISDSQSAAVAEIFRAESVIGTLVVADAEGEVVLVHNDERSAVRFSPASTFKIPNTLVALDAAVVTSANSPFSWDGSDKGLRRWNKDHTLASAFRSSCVWCYQEIARKVGDARYATALAALDYGNKIIGDRVDEFWLNGQLKISAMEQIEFLSKLVTYSLPYRHDYVDIVKSIMLVEQTADHSLHAKTGWTGAALQVGWYVGYVDKNEETWLFAMNMRMTQADQATLRKEVTVRSLRALGLL